jgi:hypothetical protein
VVAECGEQRFRVAHGTGLGVEAQVGGVAQECPGAGVGVPDAEERVGLPLGQVIAGNPGPVVGGRVQQGPAGGVAAEGQGVGGDGGGDGVDGDVEVVEGAGSGGAGLGVAV